jgi:hypothetical protein
VGNLARQSAHSPDDRVTVWARTRACATRRISRRVRSNRGPT